MLFKTKYFTKRFREDLINDKDTQYYIPEHMKRIALKEFIERHHTIDLYKKIASPSDDTNNS